MFFLLSFLAVFSSLICCAVQIPDWLWSGGVSWSRWLWCCIPSSESTWRLCVCGQENCFERQV